MKIRYYPCFLKLTLRLVFLYSCEITLGRMVRVTAIRKQDLPRPDDQDFQGSSFLRLSKDSGT